MLKIAISKGRIANSIQKIFQKVKYTNVIDFNSRKLLFKDCENGNEFILVKPSDIPIYVDSGAVDIGFVGKDVILESNCNLYEILDLKIGECKMVLAGLPNLNNNLQAKNRIATKYPKITEQYFSKKMQNIEIIKLDGSVELAPLVGLCDAILDIVETGNTLRENGLIVYEEIFNISTRMVVNKISYKTKNTEVLNLEKEIRNQIYGVDNND